jgi:hypothetical protein
MWREFGRSTIAEALVISRIFKLQQFTVAITDIKHECEPHGQMTGND